MSLLRIFTLLLGVGEHGHSLLEENGAGTSPPAPGAAPSAPETLPSAPAAEAAAAETL